MSNKNDKDLRIVFTAPLLFLNEFNTISQAENDQSEDRTNEYDDLIEYLSIKSNNKPSFIKYFGIISFNIILLIVFYYCVLSDLYLCYEYLIINKEISNFLLTLLWFILPQIIIIIGDIKAIYTKFYLNNKRVKFFCRSIVMIFVYMLKLNILEV
jgi:hypothetical protein